MTSFFKSKIVIEREPTLKDFLIECAMKSKTAFNFLHWHLYCEWNNEDNKDVKVRFYFKKIYTELLASAEKLAPAFAADCASSLKLRERLTKLSNRLQEGKEKVDLKSGILQKELSGDSEHNMLDYGQGGV